MAWKVDHPMRRFIIFVLSMVVRSIGMVLTIRAALGVSPLTTIPVAVELLVGISLGTTSTIKNIVQIVIQKGLYRKAMSWTEVGLQFVISFLFGYILDAVDFCTGWIQVSGLPAELAIMVLGCIVMAFGVYLEIVASFTMLPADGMNRAIQYVTKWDYGYIKLFTDGLVVLVAVIITVVGLGVDAIFQVVGIGTIVALVEVGPNVHWFMRHLKPLTHWLMPYVIDSRFEDNMQPGE
ncbi:MAG: DUF6198 family protein [archaeon]|nr:DUF6198 family protein [archaeon]